MARTEHNQPASGGQTFEVPDLSHRSKLGFHLKRLFGKQSHDVAVADEMTNMDWRRLPNVPEKKVAFRVRVEDFTIETTPAGKIADYKTTATVYDPDSLFTFVIEVNKPLVYKGYYFYQSSYGYEPRTVKSVELMVSDKEGKPVAAHVKLPFKKPVEVPGTDVTLVASDFAADFVYDIATKTVSTRSNEHRNPAVKIEVYRDGEKQFDQWLMMRAMGMHSSKDEKYDFRLLSYVPDAYTVLEVRTHPLMGVIWTGFGMMVVGVFLSFYVTQRRVWVAVGPGEDGTAEIHLAAASRKDKETFRRQFYGIVDELRRRSKRSSQEVKAVR
jgi:cytochrome c biogenesis protein